MYEILIYEDGKCQRNVYLNKSLATHRIETDDPDDLMSAWEQLLKVREGVTYSVWSDDECIIGGALDPWDIGIIADHLKVVRAEKCLIDNGIDPSEASTVLQALGYILMDEDLYSDRMVQWAKPPYTLEEWMKEYPTADVFPVILSQDGQRLSSAIPRIPRIGASQLASYTDSQKWAMSLPMKEHQVLNAGPDKSLISVDLSSDFALNELCFLLGDDSHCTSREWGFMGQRAQYAGADFNARLAYLQDGTSFETPFDPWCMDAADPVDREKLCEFIADNENLFVSASSSRGSALPYPFVYALAQPVGSGSQLLVDNCGILLKMTEPGFGLASSVEGRVYWAEHEAKQARSDALGKGLITMKHHPMR